MPTVGLLPGLPLSRYHAFDWGYLCQLPAWSHHKCSKSLCPSIPMRSMTCRKHLAILEKTYHLGLRFHEVWCHALVWVGVCLFGSQQVFGSMVGGSVFFGGLLIKLYWRETILQCYSAQTRVTVLAFRKCENVESCAGYSWTTWLANPLVTCSR